MKHWLCQISKATVTSTAAIYLTHKVMIPLMRTPERSNGQTRASFIVDNIIIPRIGYFIILTILVTSVNDMIKNNIDTSKIFDKRTRQWFGPTMLVTGLIAFFSTNFSGFQKFMIVAFAVGMMNLIIVCEYLLFRFKVDKDNSGTST